MLSEVTRETRRGAVTFAKSLDDAGELHLSAYDASGRAVSYDDAEDVVVPGEEPIIGEALARVVATASTEGRDPSLSVTLSVRDPAEDAEILTETGEADLSTGLVVIDGEAATPERLEQLNQVKASHLDERAVARVKKRASLLHELALREGWNWSEVETLQLAAKGSSLKLKLGAKDVARFVEANRDIVGAIDLDEGTRIDSLATAMVDTWVNPGANGLGDSNGVGIGVYLTEVSCPDSGFVTSYSRLAGSCFNDVLFDGDDCDHAKNTTSILRAVSPSAFIYCRGPSVVPTAADLASPGPGGNPRVRVTTMSASVGSATSALYRTEDRDWDDLVYFNNLLSVKSAGNNGGTGGAVTSPGKALNLVSVGNYNDAGDSINATSSFLNPTNTKNDKPELSAPGTSINAGGTTWTGTSQSAPHVAGIAADLMQAYSYLQGRPWVAKAVLMKGATDAITGGYDNVGRGGIDYFSAYYSGTANWWEGSNASFATFDAADLLPNNGSIDHFVSINASSSSVRVVLVWLNRGTYTYDHRNDTNPIGMDLDILVYEPSGVLKASSASFYNGFEAVTFDPTVTGSYRIRITRPFNRDTSSGLYAGLSIGWN